MAEGRSRSFAPTVLAGLVAAALCAVAAGRDWAEATGDVAGAHVTAAVKGSSSAPLALALALVALAAWGVVLVLRGRARPVVAVLGLLAALGVLVTDAVSGGRAHDDAVRAAVARGTAVHQTTATLAPWFFVCGAAALVTAVSFAVAVVRARRWPAMGSRYDAPAARPEPVTEQDMWRALDDGRDPTTGSPGSGA